MPKPLQILANLVSFLSQTAGRDQSCRFFQYFCRFLTNTLQTMIQNKEKIEKMSDLLKQIDSFGGNMGLTRKVLRFGRPIGIINGTVLDLITYSKKKGKASSDDLSANSVHVATKSLANISLALFFLCDHPLYFNKIGILQQSNALQKADLFSNLFWLFECIFGILADLKEIEVINRKSASREWNASADLVEEQTKLVNRIYERWVNVVRNLIDIPIAISFMKDGFLSPAQVGLLGTITSLIGCYQMW